MQIQTNKINEPCIVDVLVKNNYASISWSLGNGTDEIKVNTKDDDYGVLTFEFGDTTQIKYGGTDNWGKDLLPIYLDYKENSSEGDSVYVDDITLQEYAGKGNWCYCYRLPNGAVMYKALTKNPYNEPRVAYFRHKTSDLTIKRGFYAGRPAASEWYVTIIQEANPEGNENPTPKPEKPEIIPQDKTKTFNELIDIFNKVLSDRGKRQITQKSNTYEYLKEGYELADKEWNNKDSILFNKETYEKIEVYNYHGTNKEYSNLAYDSLQGWLFAMFLSEIVPDVGSVTNTQTKLFEKAYEIGGGAKVPLFGLDSHADPMVSRLVAGMVYSIIRGQKTYYNIEVMRKELGGSAVNASGWNGLRYVNTEIRDSIGRRGYRMDTLGYLVNTQSFLPSAPGPRIDGCTVCDQELPYNVGQSIDQFNLETQNYKMDEEVYNYMINNYNMMAETPLAKWYSYGIKKQNRIVNAMATIPCTYMYMFGKPKYIRLVLDNGRLPIVDGYPRYVFEECANSDLVIEGPFSDLAGIYRYNIAAANKNVVEQYIESVTDIADNCRFPTQDPNYGRCRPGCSPTRQGGERNPNHGAKDNELYNVSISAMVADNYAGYTKAIGQDGFASDSPRSYVSGHSVQIMTLALILGQMNPEKLEDYIIKAYQYSDNRSIARFHWTSDVIYGRIFSTFVLPLINAMDGMQSGYEVTKNIVLNHDINDDGNYNVNLIIKNLTGENIQSTGEIRLYVNNHIGVNTYLPGAVSNAGALYTFYKGENSFNNIICIMNGESVMNDNYNGAIINDARIYDHRHWNNIDAGFNVTLDTSDSRCDSTIKKSGATYVLKLTKIGEEPIEEETKPTEEGNYKVKIIIKNQTGHAIQSTGEIRLYVDNHIGVNTYLPGAAVTAGPLYTFNTGENIYDNIYCVMNGESEMNDKYNGKSITEIRFYDYRHWNNIDAGYNIELDTSDTRCDKTIKKSGATYVLLISNL